MQGKYETTFERTEIGILCAGYGEVLPFLQRIDGCSVSEKAMLKFYLGRMAGMDIITLFSGVCKVNAAIAAQILIDTYGCGAIIDAGTAGGMNARLWLFDIVVSEETAYHDVDEDILTEFHPWLKSVWFPASSSLLAAARREAAQTTWSHRVVFGRMVTGEKFIADEERETINARFAPLSTDMETASIAHVCYVNAVPFLAVRTITDTADHSGIAAFEETATRYRRTLSALCCASSTGRTGFLYPVDFSAILCYTVS